MAKGVKDANAYKNFKANESRLVARIDKREESGKNRENVDNTFNSYKTNENGQRVWSF